MIYQTVNILLTGIEGLKSMRQPSLRHYSDVYNAVKTEIIVKAADNANRINNASFRSCVTKISNRFVGSLWNIIEMK